MNILPFQVLEFYRIVIFSAAKANTLPDFYYIWHRNIGNFRPLSHLFLNLTELIDLNFQDKDLFPNINSNLWRKATGATQSDDNWQQMRELSSWTTS